ncbi:MAG TPA: fibronectin type III domain-containing protein, partial [Polyangia bacterium]
GNTTTFTRPSNTTAIQLPGLNTSNYTIDVIARNGAGTARTTVTSRATAPAAPSGLTAVAQAGLKVRLSWTDNSNNERFFEVYRSLQSGGPWTQAVVLSNAATWTDSALLPSRRYYYRVRAVNGIGASSYVNANTTTLNPCQGLGAGAACDDGSACTTGDVCNSSGVCAGVAKSCDDGNDCTVDSCSFATGICGSTPKEAGTSCDDNDVCSATSTCNGTGACLAATAVVCPEDGNPCTEEVCLSSPRGCEARFKDACDYGTCTPTGGTPAFECPAVASIEINASAMTDPVVVRAHDPPGFIVQIDPRTSRTLTLTANGATYMVENTTDGVLGNFRLSADGKIQTTDTAHFKGNGTTELVILDPDRPIANMVWEMEERLGKDDVFNLFPIVTRDPARPDVGVNPTKWNVYLDACSSVPGRTPNSSYKWVISPGLNGQQTSVDATTNCRQRFQFPALGQYAVGIEVTSQDGHKGITAQTITLKDYVVVSFGDSYASGEGNPTLPAEHVKMSGQFGPRWDDSGAHYSRWSGPTQAALLLERSDPHSSVTYLPFAASGGVITNLFSVDKENYHAWPQVFVVQPWGTVLADPGNRPPQIDLARAALCNGDPNPATFRAGTDCSQARPIDYVLLSIGGNDIGFSDTITACAVPVTINVAGEDVAHKNCSVSASGRYYGAPDWRPDGPYVSKSVERLDRLANLAIDQNPIGYGRLDQELRTRLPIGNGTKIFITEYPDALTATTDGELCPEIRLHDAAGILQSVQAVLLTGLSAIAIGPWAIGAAYVSFAITSGVCNGDPRGPDFCADGVILASELRWARDNVANRLNQIVHSTAQLGWTPVTGIAEEYAGRAYCNPMGFMVTYWESFSTQEDMFGSLHPNRGGQDVIARHLAKAMKVGDKEPALIARPTFAGTSEERPPAMCPEQSAIAGVACHGDYCDDVEIMCKSPRKDVVIETDRPISRSFFSSHQNPGVFDFCDRGVCTPHIGVNCGISGVAVGLECNGSDCTEVALHCSHLSKGRLQKCGWTETVSDESKWNVFHAGKVANGLRCFGENCDSMSFFVCDMVAE